MKKLILILITFFDFYLTPAMAQYEIQYPKWYTTTKFQTLYLISSDTSSSYCKGIYKVVQDNWKLTPVKLWQGRLAYIEEKLLEKGNLFLEVNTNSREYTIIRDNGTQGMQSSNDYFHLDVMTIVDKYNSKKSVYESLMSIASAELYNRTIGMGNIAWKSKGDVTSELFQLDFLNGMKGNIKNMIQYFNTEIPKNKTRKLFEEQSSSNELSNLKTETLYVPNYWYGNGTMLDGVKETSSDYKKTVSYLDKVVASYPYKIKFITREELNTMILSTDKSIYYLNYIQSSADKIVSISNGLNGNVIYTEVTKKSYRIKNSDLENIGKAVQ